jgi:group I intron endonuclease
MYGVIYLIRNTINNKCYIGKTIHLKRRIYEHFMGHSEGCKLLSRSIKKYGKENFSVEILHEGIIPELLNEFEIQAIRKYNTKAPHGYNLNEGGMGGVNPSEETRQRMSEAAIAREAKKYADGYIVSEETRQKLRKASTGRYYSPETRQLMSEKAKEREAKKRAEGYKVSEETLRKKSENAQRMWNERRPPKHLAKEFYFSLPDTLSLSEKRKLLLEEFSYLTHETNIHRWVREWSGIKSEPAKHPKHYDVKNYFFSLPSEMNLIAKRELCYAKFPDVLKSTIGRWIQKWGDPSVSALGHRHPKYYDVHKFFLTLPPNLDIQEKRVQCYSKFPDVLQGTIQRWINKWQPNDSAVKKYERQKNQEQGYELFMSLPCNLTTEEKRKFLREKMPNVNRRTIYDWVKKWQSELENNNPGDLLNG